MGFNPTSEISGMEQPVKWRVCSYHSNKPESIFEKGSYMVHTYTHTQEVIYILDLWLFQDVNLRKSKITILVFQEF